MIRRFWLAPICLALACTSGCAGLLGSKSTESVDLPASQSAQACLATARELAHQGRDAEAIEMYQRARRFDPKTKGVARRLAVLYDKQANVEAAQHEFQLAFEESPRDAELWNDFGYYQYQHQRFQEAEQAFRKALELKPELSRAKINLGLALGEQRRYDESFETFRCVISESAARHNVGIMQLRHGEINAAELSLQNALAIEPKLAQPQNVLNWLNDQRAAGPAQSAHPQSGPGGVYATTLAATAPVPPNNVMPPMPATTCGYSAPVAAPPEPQALIRRFPQ